MKYRSYIITDEPFHCSQLPPWEYHANARSPYEAGDNARKVYPWEERPVLDTCACIWCTVSVGKDRVLILHEKGKKEML